MVSLQRALPFLAFIGCTAVWGSTWAAIKWGLEAVPPFTAAGFRFALASLVLFAALLALRVRLPATRREWYVVAWMGLVLFGVDFALIYWGEQYLASGLASVLFATMPLWTLLMAAALRLERVTAVKLVGIGLGVTGVGVLFADSLSARPQDLLPGLALLGSAVGASAASVVMKRDGHGLHPVALNAPAMLVGAGVHFTLALVAGEPLVMPSGLAAWGSITYLALGGSVFTFLTYTWLLKRWDASRASFLTILTPLMALLLGAALFGEALSFRILAGSVLVLAGVGTALRARRAGGPAVVADADTA